MGQKVDILGLKKIGTRTAKYIEVQSSHDILKFHNNIHSHWTLEEIGGCFWKYGAYFFICTSGYCEWTAVSDQSQQVKRKWLEQMLCIPFSSLLDPTFLINIMNKLKTEEKDVVCHTLTILSAYFITIETASPLNRKDPEEKKDSCSEHSKALPSS